MHLYVVDEATLWFVTGASVRILQQLSGGDVRNIANGLSFD